jgi:hypothetical protein
MKILNTFRGKVLTFNTGGPSRVMLTDLSNNNSCQTDANSVELQNAGINHDGCEFEVQVVDENGRQRGIMKKIEPTIIIKTESVTESTSSFDI